ncbi:MAG: N-acetylmuramoyl-L-alanine amidase [Deltaproteobacteria bacterium]|nr:N-acetylmuramoyl-L-alanine amidase [Deltaproteobacteria bacterium]
MIRFRWLLIPVIGMLLFPSPLPAAVEIALRGQEPKRLEEVYNLGGLAYLALDDLLPPLGLKGGWDAVDHVYRIHSWLGTAVLFPGGRYLRMDNRFVPLVHPPRFIDGRFRVAEDFVREQLPLLLGVAVSYRNLDPLPVAAPSKEAGLDHLFSFLLRKKGKAGRLGLRGVAIDPGHGGTDPGAVGLYGVKEKDVVLEIALLLAKEIKMRLGIPVFLTRDKDYSLTLRQRLEQADKPEVDALIILHAQSSFRESAEGATLFIRPEGGAFGQAPHSGEESRQLARKLADTLYAGGLRVNGIRPASLLPLGEGDLPTVLVELGYLSHPEDNARLTDSEAQKKLAQALYQGIQRFSAARKENLP